MKAESKQVQCTSSSLVSWYWFVFAQMSCKPSKHANNVHFGDNQLSLWLLYYGKKSSIRRSRRWVAVLGGVFVLLTRILTLLFAIFWCYQDFLLICNINKLASTVTKNALIAWEKCNYICKIALEISYNPYINFLK